VTEYALSRRAQSDLDEIWDYSAQRWGRDQANRYVEALRDSIKRVAAEPSRGRSMTVGHKSYQRYRSRSHLIFYRKTNRGIRIVRILHESMDHERHLR
jgi:toxin ParE1/3/4